MRVSVESENVDDEEVEEKALEEPGLDDDCPLAVVGVVSHSYISYKDFALRFVRQKSTVRARPKIPATAWERLSFFRYYFNAISETQTVFLQPFFYREYFWRTLCWHLAFLSHYYIILFLSLYAPQEHYYASKMVPILKGIYILKILATLFALSMKTDILARIIDYTIRGVIYRAPWNRCIEKTVFIRNLGMNFTCYSLNEFNELNKTNMFHDYFHYQMNRTYIEPSQIIFFMQHIDRFKRPSLNNFILLYYLIIWISLLFLYDQLFKRTVWKFFHYLVWLLSGIYIITIFYIELAFFLENLEPLTYKVDTIIENQKVLFLDRVALFAAATPVIHLIHARSNSEIKPGRDSGFLIVSSMLFYIIQGLVYTRLTHYCEAKARISIQYGYSNSFPIFFMYPMFFSFLSIGPLFTKLFFVIVFLIEYVTVHITFYSFVEVLDCEWPSINHWKISISTSIVLYIWSSMLETFTRFGFHAISAYVVNVIEILAITYVYPWARLVEDINFYYYSETLSTFRLLSFQVLPCLLLWEFYTMFKDDYTLLNAIPLMGPIVMLCLLPIYGFAFYMVLRKKMSYFKHPVSNWGPPEYLVRMFRKEFDSSKFIDSLSPRFLSRHMLRRAEPPSYRLGMQYKEGRTHASPARTPSISVPVTKNT